MALRFRYSMWDGTQDVPDLTADEVLDNLTDDLMNFGDLQHALKNMMQRGMRNPAGDRMQGLRDLLQQLRQQRRQQLDRFDLSSIFDDLKRQLDEIVGMERDTLDRRLDEANGQQAPRGEAAQEQQTGEQRPSSAAGEAQPGGTGDGDPQQGGQPQQGGTTPPGEFADMLRNIANRKKDFLEQLPEDVAGQVKGLQDYEFMDPEAQARFNELLESLKKAMMDTFFKDMYNQIANMTPEDLARMKDMVRDLNQMLQDKMAGREPDFDKFMQQYGDLFGDNPPQSLDELIQQMQHQMGQMQSLLDSAPGRYAPAIAGPAGRQGGRPRPTARAQRARPEPRVPLPDAGLAEPVSVPGRRGDRPPIGDGVDGPDAIDRRGGAPAGAYAVRRRDR